jgi:hypothetical protein
MDFLPSYSLGVSAEIAAVARILSKQVLAQFPRAWQICLLLESLAQTLPYEFGLCYANGFGGGCDGLVHFVVETYCDSH